MARRWSAAYLLRLTLVAGACAIPWLVLSSTRFVENLTCHSYAHVRTVPEHLTFSALLVLTLLFHWPTVTRLFGRRPDGIAPRTCARGGEPEVEAELRRRLAQGKRPATPRNGH